MARLAKISNGTVRGSGINPVDIALTSDQNIALFPAPLNIHADEPTVTLVSGTSRILLTNQADSSQNGVWIYNGDNAALTRPADYKDTANHEIGEFVSVKDGSKVEKTYVLNRSSNADLQTVEVDTDDTLWSEVGASKSEGTFTLDDTATQALSAADIENNQIILINGTNAGNAIINSIPAGNEAQELILVNTSGFLVKLENADAAVDDIVTGTGGNLSIPDDNAVHLVYNSNDSRWHVVDNAAPFSEATFDVTDAATTANHALLEEHVANDQIILIPDGTNPNDGTATINSIQPNGPGKLFTIINRTDFNVTLVHQDAANTDILTPDGNDLVIPHNNSAILSWSDNHDRWHVVSTSVSSEEDVSSQTAGEALIAGDIVRYGIVATLAETAGSIYKADAADKGANPEEFYAIGVAKAAAAAAAAVDIQNEGEYSFVDANFSTVPTAGTHEGLPVFLDASNEGQLTMTPPSASGEYIVKIGMLKSTAAGAHVVFLDIDVVGQV